MERRGWGERPAWLGYGEKIDDEQQWE